jgi:hypothetical protein
VPPDWSGGYSSIFALQQGEEWDAAQLAQAMRTGTVAAPMM